AKHWVTFGLDEWKNSQRHANGAFCIYFEFHNLPHELRLLCSVTPGELVDRAKLFQMAHNNHFSGSQPKLNTGTYRASIIQVLQREDYQKQQAEIEALISEKWQTYLHDELPRMAKAIREEKWLWELP
ncbi:MAG: hypothetical protein ACRYFS_13815, partial [Janthinobacterium lividum]